MSGAVVKGTAVGVPLIGGIGLSVTYQTTKENGKQALEKRSAVLVGKDDDAWTKMFTVFSGKEESNLKNDVFKDFLKKVKAKGSDSKPDKGDLYDFCKAQSDVTYKSIFSTNKDFLSDLLSSCTISLKNYADITLNDMEKDKLDHDALKDYSQSTELDEKLKGVQTNLKNDNDGKKSAAKEEHVNWCKSKGINKYRGSNDSEYKIFKEICKKKTSND